MGGRGMESHVSALVKRFLQIPATTAVPDLAKLAVGLLELGFEREPESSSRLMEMEFGL